MQKNKINNTKLRTAIGIGIGLTILAVAGCSTSNPDQPPSKVQIVVTTNILTDVVQNIVGDQAEVLGLMPPGSDPHSFALSAQQAAQLEKAELVIFNGLGLEGGLLNNIEAVIANGVSGLEIAELVNPIRFDAETSAESHEDESGEDHGEAGHEEGHAQEDHADHDHSTGEDPHFW
ncbi:MAG: metal ABC transporter substrate-binding protein, partial [Microbacteriaceae bacterium]